MNTAYKWAPKFDAGEVSAAAVFHELEDMGNGVPSGAVSPSDIVSRARSEDSAMHALFEWDDGKAACQHRKGQAELIAKSLLVEADGYTPRKACHAVTIDVEGAVEYTPLSVDLQPLVPTARDRGSLYPSVAAAELRDWLEKYGTCDGASDLVDEVRRVVAWWSEEGEQSSEATKVA